MDKQKNVIFQKVQKDGNNITIEGYLSDTESQFNGVLFLMKEPNGNVEEDPCFWFKKVCTEERAKPYFQEQENREKQERINSKRTATKFRNRFSELLKWYCSKPGKPAYELKNCAYMNYHWKRGGTKESLEFTKKLQCRCYRRQRWNILEQLEPEIIFTCGKIFEALAAEYKGSPIYNGVQYQRGNKTETLPYMDIKIGRQKCRVYEIRHPSSCIHMIERIPSILKDTKNSQKL